MTISVEFGGFKRRLNGPHEARIPGWTKVAVAFIVLVRDDPALEIDVDIYVEYSPALHHTVVTEVHGLIRPGGPPVSNFIMRSIPVRSFVQQGVALATVGRLLDDNGVMSVRPIEQIVDEAIAKPSWREQRDLWVFRVYRFAQIFGLNPAKEVERLLHTSPSTATRWIRSSRAHGYFDVGDLELEVNKADG